MTTQDKSSAKITKWVKTDTETVTKSGGSGLLVKSEFQVYQVDAGAAKGAFLYSYGVLLDVGATIHRCLAEVRQISTDDAFVYQM